jgi:hypothetical protein
MSLKRRSTKSNQQHQQEQQSTMYARFLKWFSSYNQTQHQRYFNTNVCQQCFYDLNLEQADIEGDLIYNQQLRFAHLNAFCYICCFVLR